MNRASQYRLIVFDWDGTVMDSTGLIAECIQIVAREYELPVPDVERAKSIIGLGIQDSVFTLFPGISEAEATQFALRYRFHFVARDHEAPLYAGIPALLTDLAAPERFLAVATGKPRRGLERAFDATGLRGHFHYSRCADEGFAKPHPDMLHKLMVFTGVSADETLMIGDTTHDLQLASNAGTDALAVSYGAHPREVLATAPRLAIVDTVEELRCWLMTNH